LDYYTHGAPSDCVFIHGAGGNNLLWKRSLQFLSGPKRAFAVNLPGHPSGDVTCRTVGEYAGAVYGFISEEGLGRVAVCGHSMGSAIALTVALEHPGAVSGLILVDGGAKLGVSPPILEGLSNQPLRAIEELITPMSFHAVDLAMGREARTALSLSNLAIFLNDYRACDGFDVRDKLPSISAKSMIVCGEDDRMTPPRYSQYLNARIPGSSMFLIPDAGHMVPLEKPEALGRLIQTFLSPLSL
jgi:pimeloyl-ACP methyl ester carboxylesterase